MVWEGHVVNPPTDIFRFFSAYKWKRNQIQNFANWMTYDIMYCPVFPQLVHYRPNSVELIHHAIKVTADIIANPAKELVILSIFILPLFVTIKIISSSPVSEPFAAVQGYKNRYPKYNIGSFHYQFTPVVTAVAQ